MMTEPEAYVAFTQAKQKHDAANARLDEAILAFRTGLPPTPAVKSEFFEAGRNRIIASDEFMKAAKQYGEVRFALDKPGSENPE